MMTTIYRVGDTDPTPELGDSGGYCDAQDADGGPYCTWPADHDPEIPHVAGSGIRIMAVWGGGRPGITITRDQLEAWVGYPLTDDQVSDLEDAISTSSIPEAFDLMAGGAGMRPVSSAR